MASDQYYTYIFVIAASIHPQLSSCGKQIHGEESTVCPRDRVINYQIFVNENHNFQRCVRKKTET